MSMDEIRIQDDVEGHDLRREASLPKDEDTEGNRARGPLQGDNSIRIEDDVEGHINNRPLDHDTFVNNRPLDNA
ncbi:MAG TPA: hypothetical protein VF855_11280 [Acidimicrobiales bacterium]